MNQRNIRLLRVDYIRNMLPSLYTSEANSCNSTKRLLTQKATIKKRLNF